MSFLVNATGHARRQIETAGRWWLANRDKAPELFVNELDAAHVLLAVEPGAGTAFPTPRYPSARRLLMVKTGYHLYYTVHDEEKIVLIRAVWHASRDGCRRCGEDRAATLNLPRSRGHLVM